MATFSRRVSAALIVAAAVAVAGLVAPASAASRPAVKVSRLVPAQPSQVAAGELSILVFFDFKPTSRALFERIAAWAGEIGENIVLDREPLVAARTVPLARAFVVARTLGVTRAVLPALFGLAEGRGRSGKRALPNKSAIADAFAAVGINAIEFDAAWHSRASADGLLRARAMVERFEVHKAPVVIVNGAWKVVPSAGASAARLMDAVRRVINQKVDADENDAA